MMVLIDLGCGLVDNKKKLPIELKKKKTSKALFVFSFFHTSQNKGGGSPFFFTQKKSEGLEKKTQRCATLTK